MSIAQTSDASVLRARRARFRWDYVMNFEIVHSGKLLVVLCAGAALAGGQVRQTMHPVVLGRSYAVASLKPQATQVAERILRAGGNAFDAAVAGQAVLGLTDAAMNGIGGGGVDRL